MILTKLAIKKFRAQANLPQPQQISSHAFILPIFKLTKKNQKWKKNIINNFSVLLQIVKVLVTFSSYGLWHTSILGHK